MIRQDGFGSSQQEESDEEVKVETGYLSSYQRRPC